MKAQCRGGRMMIGGCAIWLMTHAAWPQEKANDPSLVFHAPFDGKLDALCDGKPLSVLNVPDCRFEPGPVGQAVVTVTDAVEEVEQCVR